MYIPFDQLPDDSRIWIYQANRKLNENESHRVEDLCRQFVDQWTAHKQDLQASFELKDNRFLILSVNEKTQGASGCSIDASTRFIQQLGESIQVDLMNREVALESQSEVHLMSLSEIKKAVTDGKLKKDAYYFNNLIQSKGELENSWKLPVTKGWMSRYFNEKKEIVN